jgi:hypothetical protein
MIDNYRDLTLGAFLRLSAIPEDLDPLDRQVEILAVLSDATVDEILKLPLDEYRRRVDASRFLDEDMPARLPQASYKVGPFTLVPIRKRKNILTAQFIDFKKYCEAAGDNLAPYTVELLSCMLTPDGRDYCDGYDPEDVQDALREHLRADDAIALSAFFLAKWMRSSRRTLIYSLLRSNRKTRKALRPQIRQLRKMRKTLLTPSR